MIIKKFLLILGLALIISAVLLNLKFNYSSHVLNRSYKKYTAITPIQPLSLELLNQESHNGSLVYLGRHFSWGYYDKRSIISEKMPPVDIYVSIPYERQVSYISAEDNLLTSEVTFNDITYQFKAGLAGRNFDCYDCTHTFEEISTAPPLKIAGIKLWNKSSGIYMINPFEIEIEGYYINYITIMKIAPNKIFTQSEFEIWKNILRSIAIWN